MTGAFEPEPAWRPVGGESYSFVRFGIEAEEELKSDGVRSEAAGRLDDGRGVSGAEPERQEVLKLRTLVCTFGSWTWSRGSPGLRVKELQRQG